MSSGAVVLAFDFGTRRIGVAIANTLTRVAQPLQSLQAKTVEQRWAGVQRCIEEWAPAQLVVGIPRYADGNAHEMTVLAQKLARQLQGRFALPVACVDERYSSAVVEDADDVDAAAAAVILQQWLDEAQQNKNTENTPHA